MATWLLENTRENAYDLIQSKLWFLLILRQIYLSCPRIGGPYTRWAVEFWATQEKFLLQYKQRSRTHFDTKKKSPHLYEDFDTAEFLDANGHVKYSITGTHWWSYHTDKACYIFFVTYAFDESRS